MKNFDQFSIITDHRNNTSALVILLVLSCGGLYDIPLVSPLQKPRLFWSQEQAV